MNKKLTFEELEKRVIELEAIEQELTKTDMMLKDEINWRRLLVEESRDSIVVLDQNARVFDVNQRFADMLGYSKEEVCQLHVWDWDAHFTKEQISEMIDSVNDSGQHFETQHRRKDGSHIDVELSNNGAVYRGQKLIFCICRDISHRKKSEKEREELIQRLRDSLAEIRTLRGILPICSFCKKVRDDRGYWQQVDIYIKEHSEADISHSICPDCMKNNFPDEYEFIYPQQDKTEE